jgi:hypothetical protein
MADRNGDGIVYHRSDCGDNNVRFYGLGGDGPCSTCESWGLTDKAIAYIHAHPEINHRIEDVTGSEWDEEVVPVLDLVEKEILAEIKEGYEEVKEGVYDAYQWADKNACSLAVTAAIGLGCVAAFAPEQPEGAVASTSLSLMAQPVLYVADKAAKVAVVMAMTEIITDGFLLIPYVKDSIDHTLLKNIISNCLGKSLDSAELWATPQGVGIAIGAAFAPVIAELICTKTCPQGFTKAFGA